MLDKNEEETVWRTYPEYPFIQANQFGEIRTIDRTITDENGRKRFVKGRLLKQHINKANSYVYVSFNVNGKSISRRSHRIVASCFLPNPDNLPEVNHIDCNRANNAVDNLEFCTRQYNNAYKEKFGISSKEAAKAQRKPLYAVNLKTGKVLQFESRSEVVRQLGVNQAHVNDVLAGRRNQTGGYWFTESKSEITEEKIQEVKNNMIFLDGVIAVNLKTLKTLRFDSQRDAARQLGINFKNINNVIKGLRKTVGGYWVCRADKNAVEKARDKFGDETAYEVDKLLSDEL